MPTSHINTEILPQHDKAEVLPQRRMSAHQKMIAKKKAKDFFYALPNIRSVSRVRKIVHIKHSPKGDMEERKRTRTEERDSIRDQVFEC